MTPETHNKLTVNDILEQEKESWIDALTSGAIELHAGFLLDHAGPAVFDLLKSVPLSDRAFVLDGNIGHGWFPGFPCKAPTDCIKLETAEIEIPFTGDPADTFEEPDRFFINDNPRRKLQRFAYYYVGYGLCFEIDLDGLKADIEDYC